MAAVLAEKGRVRFGNVGDVYTPLSNKEIMCVAFTPAAAGDAFDLSIGSDTIAEGISTVGDSVIIPTFGCINTSGAITFDASGGSCIIYLK